METILILMIFAVMLCYLSSSGRNFRPERDSNPDLCDAGSNQSRNLDRIYPPSTSLSSTHIMTRGLFLESAENFTGPKSFVAQDAFVLLMPRELCHPKYARKVSGLSRNGQLVEHCTCIVEFCSRLNFSGLSFATAQVT